MIKRYVLLGITNELAVDIGSPFNSIVFNIIRHTDENML